jgi:hypothetical protein
VKIIEVLGNVVLTVTLPGRGGKRLKRLKPQSIYTGIKPEWVTVLPDDFIFSW